jgi:hypothetical protein
VWKKTQTDYAKLESIRFNLIINRPVKGDYDNLSRFIALALAMRNHVERTTGR